MVARPRREDDLLRLLLHRRAGQIVGYERVLTDIDGWLRQIDLLSLVLQLLLQNLDLLRRLRNGHRPDDLGALDLAVEGTLRHG